MPTMTSIHHQLYYTLVFCSTYSKEECYREAAKAIHNYIHNYPYTNYPPEVVLTHLSDLVSAYCERAVQETCQTRIH